MPIIEVHRGPPCVFGRLLLLPRCSRCRYRAHAVKVTPALRRWWLDRYTLDEIRELAAGIASL
jgi:hypothetical protein